MQARLALVPASCQEGDLIVPLDFGMHGNSYMRGKFDSFVHYYKSFVFRPRELHMYENGSNNNGKPESRELPKMKCDFVGGCFRHGSYPHSPNFILLL